MRTPDVSDKVDKYRNDQTVQEIRKQAKEHYGVACFRKLLHLKEIIFTNNQNSIANDELYSNPQINRELSDGQQ